MKWRNIIRQACEFLKNDLFKTKILAPNCGIYIYRHGKRKWKIQNEYCAVMEL